MAKVQSLHSCPSLAITKIHFCALLFVLVNHHDIPFAEARPIRSLNKRELVSMEAETKPINSHHNPAGQKDLPPTTSNHIPRVVQLTPQKEETLFQDAQKEVIGFDNKPEADTDDFRPTAPGITEDFKPTAPGHSPGVGHAFVGSIGTHQSKALVNGSSTSLLTGDAEDFKPTEPGHSPGVGHSLPTTSADMNP